MYQGQTVTEIVTGKRGSGRQLGGASDRAAASPISTQRVMKEIDQPRPRPAGSRAWQTSAPTQRWKLHHKASSVIARVSDHTGALNDVGRAGYSGQLMAACKDHRSNSRMIEPVAFRPRPQILKLPAPCWCRRDWNGDRRESR